jgi:MFS family permease
MVAREIFGQRANTWRVDAVVVCDENPHVKTPSQVLGAPPVSVGEALDRAPWSGIHLRIAGALGVAWILDGFETTVTGPVLANVAHELQFSGAAAAWVNPIYTVGMLAGAVIFGPLADRLGRRRLFMLTLAIYAIATVLTGFSWDFRSLVFFRLLTGIGIGGEYGAINSAIEEFTPPRYRGRVDGVINASWNIGAVVASAAAFAALGLLPTGAWRVVFWFGAIVAVAVVFVRSSVPESPRWLLARGRAEEARAVVARLFFAGSGADGSSPAVAQSAQPSASAGYLAEIGRLWRRTPARLLFSFVLNLAQVMPYYGILAIGGLAIFPAVGITGKAIPLLYLLSAATGFVGQLVMAWLSDAWGRRPTMLLSFAAAALLCAALAGAHTTSLFVVVFVIFGMFSAACGAGAYVVISELFPTDLRATGIGLSVAIGRIGAIVAPVFFFALNARIGVGAVFAAMGTIFGVGALAMLWWYRYGVEGRGLSLEQMLESGIR